jgi:hypothetical protein
VYSQILRFFFRELGFLLDIKFSWFVTQFYFIKKYHLLSYACKKALLSSSLSSFQIPMCMYEKLIIFIVSKIYEYLILLLEIFLSKINRNQLLKVSDIHLITQISTMYHCNISCNFRNYYQKYDQFLPIDSDYRFSKL